MTDVARIGEKSNRKKKMFKNLEAHRCGRCGKDPGLLQVLVYPAGSANTQGWNPEEGGKLDGGDTDVSAKLGIVTKRCKVICASLLLLLKC